MNSGIQANQVKNVINLDKKDEDKKRKEIGFETESILDDNWKEIKVDYSKTPWTVPR